MGKRKPRPRTARAETGGRLQEPVPDGRPVEFLDRLQSWPASWCYAALVAVTLLCLIPFSGKAFHIDDTLFLFSAKQIVQHPLDPFGFQVVWNTTAERMSDVTKNPPLACYYAALIGITAGWSEVALHSGFLLAVLGVVLGTYRLATRLTRWPVLAAVFALFTPGILVSASSVMCDTLMVALWLWAAIFWIEGLEPRKPLLLLASGLLVAASALTKYFGAALIPLLLVYSLIRLRRLGWWAAYLAIPCLALVGYEIWTSALYGQGLLASAAEYAGTQRESQQGSTAAHALVDLSFAGGCTLPALTLVPLLWSRRQIVPGALASVLAALALVWNWVDFGSRVGGFTAAQSVEAQWLPIGFQLTLCVAAGLSILALAIADAWRRRDAGSWFLALWVTGTLFFAGFVNWTVNARSVLPLIPAAGILIVRRLERPEALTGRRSASLLAAGLGLTVFLSLWVCAADAAWANSVRTAVTVIREKTINEKSQIFFRGHWGFQYYMQGAGFTAADEVNSDFRAGDMVVSPENNSEYAAIPPQFDLILAQPVVQVLSHHHLATMESMMGAGFYSAYWGPLPFAFGNVSPEQYLLVRLVPHRAAPASH